MVLTKCDLNSSGASPNDVPSGALRPSSVLLQLSLEDQEGEVLESVLHQAVLPKHGSLQKGLAVNELLCCAVLLGASALQAKATPPPPSTCPSRQNGGARQVCCQGFGQKRQAFHSFKAKLACQNSTVSGGMMSLF